MEEESQQNKNRDQDKFLKEKSKVRRKKPIKEHLIQMDSIFITNQREIIIFILVCGVGMGYFLATWKIFSHHLDLIIDRQGTIYTFS